MLDVMEMKAHCQDVAEISIQSFCAPNKRREYHKTKLVDTINVRCLAFSPAYAEADVCQKASDANTICCEFECRYRSGRVAQEQ